MDIVRKTYEFYRKYSGEKRILGASSCGLPIVALFAGRHEFPQIIVQCAIHAREWVTAMLVPELIARETPRGGVWFVPLANPDGVSICIGGEKFLKQLPVQRAQFLRALNAGDDFSLWKSNANGVDLNVNFSAGWGTGVQNVHFPAPANYIGPRPFSEAETRVLRDFTLQVKPDATLSYHTKGEEIYWEYGQKGEALFRDQGIALALAEETGYCVKRITGSGGGYKDWCVRHLKIPAFTLEAGRDELSHPLGESEFGEILQKNQDVLRRLSAELCERR